jgi:minor extracellular serine protease Vpr
MNRSIYIPLIIILITISSNLFSQNNRKAKLSAFTQLYLLEQKKSVEKNTSLPNVVYKRINNINYLSSFIKVSPSIDEEQLKNLGVIIGTKAGNIWTTQIPEINFEEFISIKGIEYIQLDEPIVKTLEAAKKTTKVDSVHAGINLPLAYTGKNVVVGILDVGIDYTHPTFYDTLGNKYRIKKVWEQKTNGTPPSGYSYGHELSDSLSMMIDGTDIATQTHGTHVAGISSGSGFGSPSPSKNRGVAYESDLVMVGITPAASQWTSAGMSDIIDGMNYVYNYAASVSKPAVVNLSWGCTIGPHDGTSLFSQACDNLTGAGKLFVISAGNNGTNNVHVSKTFNSSDTILKTMVNFNSSFPQKKNWLDIWGEPSKPFKVKLSLYNVITLVSETRFFTLNNTSIDTFLVGNLNDTCYFKISLINSDYNNKPHALIDVYNKTTRSLLLSVKGTQGLVHAWQGYVNQSSGIYGSFSIGGISGASAGNSDYTIGEMACTKSAITIGAYASKVTYTTIAGAPMSYNSYVNVNKIVPFSSHGPTTDQRTKPDITAPGLTIASAVNVYDTSYTAVGSSKSNVVESVVNPLNGKTYYYAEMSGTSMSSPMAAGIVALMLQANPALTPDIARTTITQTAIKDAHTTATPNPVLWGAGKINAYDALKYIINGTNINYYSAKESEYQVYPNPSDGVLNIKTIYIPNDKTSIKVYDLKGKLVFENKIVEFHENEFALDLSNLENGIYFTELKSGNKKTTIKTVILK